VRRPAVPARRPPRSELPGQRARPAAARSPGAGAQSGPAPRRPFPLAADGVDVATGLPALRPDLEALSDLMSLQRGVPTNATGQFNTIVKGGKGPFSFYMQFAYPSPGTAPANIGLSNALRIDLKP
jgi:hypothetical protein